MKRDESSKRKADALVKILEGEAELLADTVSEAIHWDRPNEIRAALGRIRRKTNEIAESLGIEMPIAPTHHS